MDKSTAKENIRKARIDLKMSQSELASKMGISRTAYRNLEKGETRIFNSHLSTLAEITGKSEEELVLGYVPRHHADELRELTSLRERNESLVEDYERRLAEARETIEAKNTLIKSLENHIRTLEEMVALMERQLLKNT